ncbi:MAG: AMP-binding protein [Ilumatobacteraceae bacterium]
MLTFADIFEAHADSMPQAVAISYGDRDVTWGDYDDSAARLASAFAVSGLGVGSKVGMFMYNCPEYLVTQYAAFKSRITPVNVNYRYLDDELWYLLDNSDCEAVVFHASLGDRIGRIKDRLPKLKLLIEVADGPTAGVAGARSWNETIASHQPAARQARAVDDLYMLYTGGTTGMPKGVMYSTGTFTEGFLAFYTGPMGRGPFTSVAEVNATAKGLHAAVGQPVAIPACPLMHGTGVWLGALLPHLMAGKVVLLEGRSFDAHEMFRAIEKHRVGSLVIVGDAFARPMMNALREKAATTAYDASSVTTIISTGAMFSAEVKAGIFEHMPGAIVMDILGSSEGGMAQTMATKDNVNTTAKFGAMPNTKVFGPDDTEVAAGSGVVGMVGVSGPNVPLGYYKDPEKSARTFREIDGVRYSFPGDMATVEADGTINLLGRGSNCINTAGEKVFPEEVEEAVKTHGAVADCLIFGIPDEKYGSRVVGVASTAAGQSTPSGDEVIAYTKTKLSSYKVPKELVFVATVPRAPNGKADYVTARQLFESGGGTS